MSEQAVRRHLLPEAQESLLLCMVALDVPFRFEEFAGITGLADQAIYSTPLLAVPIPRYFDIPEGQRRWKGVNPAVLWHPLFWLPPRVADRYELSDDDGDTELEDDDTWAVRVALEMTLSGLYDPADGSWVDILHLAGIDITTVASQARVRAWLNGAADSVLDAIDLSDYLTVNDDPDWAIGSAMQLLPIVRGASASVIAASLHAMVEADQLYPAIQRNLIARMASSLLPDDAGDLPTAEDDKPTAMLKLAKIATRFEPQYIELVALDDEGGGDQGAVPEPPTPDSDDPDEEPTEDSPFSDAAIEEFFVQEAGRNPGPHPRRGTWQPRA